MKAKTGLFAIANKAVMLLGVLLVGLPSAGADSSEYILIDSGQCDEPITSSSDCNAAAVQLGLSDTTASNQAGSVSHDPPGCWFEAEYSGYYHYLYFNTGTSNTGQCSDDDQCLCYTPSCSCDTITITLSGGATSAQGGKAGDYTKVAGVTQGGRPVYQQSGGSNYLYFWESESYSNWLVGTDYNSASFGLVSTSGSNSQCPETDPGPWGYLSGSAIVPGSVDVGCPSPPLPPAPPSPPSPPPSPPYCRELQYGTSTTSCSFNMYNGVATCTPTGCRSDCPGYQAPGYVQVPCPSTSVSLSPSPPPPKPSPPPPAGVVGGGGDSSIAPDYDSNSDTDTGDVPVAACDSLPAGGICCTDAPDSIEYGCPSTIEAPYQCAKGQCIPITANLCIDGPSDQPDYVCGETEDTCGRGVCVPPFQILCGTEGTTICPATHTCCGVTAETKETDMTCELTGSVAMNSCLVERRRSSTTYFSAPYIYLRSYSPPSPPPATASDSMGPIIGGAGAAGAVALGGVAFLVWWVMKKKTKAQTDTVAAVAMPVMSSTNDATSKPPGESLPQGYEQSKV